MDRDIPSCGVCGLPAQLLNAHHPGYQQPDTFGIYACDACDLQFSWPLMVAPRVYEHIYANAGQLPGYDAYAAFAERIGAEPNPLEWLAQQNPGYWFVREALAAHHDRAKPILEIGSGLGYLTYALRKAGYDAQGIDVSENAVEGACRRFGQHYRVADAHALANAEPGSVDTLVMLEVLEHLDEPIGILKSLHRLLSPGGMALVTTPNKSSHALGAYWQTDNPPVHQWWFSETAMRRLAIEAGFKFNFWDFSRYNGVEHPIRTSHLSPAKPPMLDMSGTPIVKSKSSSLKALRERLLPGDKKARRRARRQQALANAALQRSELMGMVLVKP